MRGIYRSPVNSPHKRQCFVWSAWIIGWENNHGTSDLKRHRAHYDVIVIVYIPKSSSSEASKFAVGSIIRNWQNSNPVNDCGYKDWNITRLNETDSVMSTAERIPTKILLGWRSILKRAKPKRTNPLPVTIIKMHIGYKTSVIRVITDIPPDRNKTLVSLESLPVDWNTPVDGVTFISEDVTYSYLNIYIYICIYIYIRRYLLCYVIYMRY